MKNNVKGLLITLGLMPFYDYVGKSNKLLNAPYVFLFVLIGLVVYMKWISRQDYQTNGLQKLVSVIFALCTWLTTVYSSGIETINQIINQPIWLLLSVLNVIAFFLILESLQIIVMLLYDKQKKEMVLSKIGNSWYQFFIRHPFLFTFILLSLCWGIVGVSAYPGVFMGDSMDQIMQSLGYADKSAAHPVVSTMLIGTCVKIGQTIGNPDIGIFIFTLIQLTFLASCVAYAVSLTARQINSHYFLFFTVFFYAFAPSIQGTILLGTKDIVFSGFVLLFTVTLFTYFYNKSLFYDKKLAVIYVFSVFFMVLFRYNTLHFMVLTLVVYFIASFFVRESVFKVKSIVPITLVALVMGVMVNSVLVSQYVETQPKPNRREMLSVPFQFTARYIKYHEEDITKQDKKTINAVLDYEVIKESYDPYRSDPVKRTHNEDATTAEMSAYFKLVGKQALAHPLVAFESFAVSHSNLFNVNQSMNIYYSNSLLLGSERESQVNAYNAIQLKEYASVKRMNHIRVRVYEIVDRMPVLSQLNNYGVGIFLLFSMFAVYLRNKKYLLAGALIPLFAFIGTLLAGPITIGYIRYLLPVILATPILVAFFINEPTGETRRI